MILAQQLRSLAANMIRVADALQQQQTVETIGPFRFHRTNGTIMRGKRVIQLRRAEQKLLTALLDNRGVVVSRDELTALLFGAEAVNVVSRTVDTHIRTLRSILGNDAIVTVFKRGYRLA